MQSDGSAISRRACLQAVAAFALFHSTRVLAGEGGVRTEERKARVWDIDPAVDEPEITDRVYLDLSIEGGGTQRVVIGLYGTVTPRTVANFKALVREGYAGTRVYRVVPGLTVQLGDVLRNGGKSGRDATGGAFEMENVRVRHSVPGLVSMATDRGRVDCRFFVNTREGESGYLDGRYCAFGRVVQGMAVWHDVERRAGGMFVRRAPRVEIVQCGVL